jgi:hypothetical protein
MGRAQAQEEGTTGMSEEAFEREADGFIFPTKILADVISLNKTYVGFGYE